MAKQLKRDLFDVVHNMDLISGPQRDLEGAHTEADELLQEALKLLARRFPSQRSLITDLLAAYEQVEKWYA